MIIWMNINRSQSESLFTFCASLTVCLSLSDETEKTSEYGRSITSSVISENLSLLYGMVSVKIISKNVWLNNFFATQQFRRFWWLILPLILLAYTACKELKIENCTNYSCQVNHATLSSFEFSSLIRPRFL